MKIKTSELIGATLDWAVAKCEDLHTGIDGFWSNSVLERDENPFEYSTDWSLGGPITDREIDKYQRIPDTESGFVFVAGTYSGHMGAGPTLLIAVMRCYVASKLGDEVEIPDQLTS